MNDHRIDPMPLIPTAISMIQSELGRIDDNRTKNRHWAIVIVGAVIGFSLREPSRPTVWFLGLAGVVLSLLFWQQDCRLHRYHHGWRSMGHRVRQFIRGETDEKDFHLLQYDDNDENKAGRLSIAWSSAPVFIALLLGSAGAVIYKIFLNP